VGDVGEKEESKKGVGTTSDLLKTDQGTQLLGALRIEKL